MDNSSDVGVGSGLLSQLPISIEKRMITNRVLVFMASLYSDYFYVQE
jgi:hypothetical protein